MALEQHEIRQLEDRFERLENKLKTTFIEVEKRLDSLKTMPVDIQDRIQELEDLILLTQLEITKMKDRMSISTDFLAPDTPALSDRLSRVEETLGLYQRQDQRQNDNVIPETRGENSEGEYLSEPQKEYGTPDSTESDYPAGSQDTIQDRDALQSESNANTENSGEQDDEDSVVQGYEIGEDEEDKYQVKNNNKDGYCEITEADKNIKTSENNISNEKGTERDKSLLGEVQKILAGR